MIELIYDDDDDSTIAAPTKHTKTATTTKQHHFRRVLFSVLFILFILFKIYYLFTFAPGSRRFRLVVAGSTTEQAMNFTATARHRMDEERKQAEVEDDDDCSTE